MGLDTRVRPKRGETYSSLKLMQRSQSGADLGLGLTGSVVSGSASASSSDITFRKSLSSCLQSTTRALVSVKAAIHVPVVLFGVGRRSVHFDDRDNDNDV